MSNKDLKKRNFYLSYVCSVVSGTWTLFAPLCAVSIPKVTLWSKMSAGALAIATTF